MKLGPQLNWAFKMLEVLRDPPEVVLQSVTPERLKEKQTRPTSSAAPMVGRWIEGGNTLG